MSPTLLFALFTAMAFVLFVLEVFVPGGILGISGGVCLLTACGFAIAAFGPTYGSFTALLLILGTLCGFMFWLMKMPDSRIGKRFALQTAIKKNDTIDPNALKTGDRGRAETDLRPGGFARINGKKTDVVAVSGYIEKNNEIEVVEVHGSRVVVRPLGKELI
ncbi:NfeD family protein [Kiritimatiellaeota bacterium B1221]|nr:NfeD family protein [Kiritimatiellaeota bacterium B1221]